MQHNLTDLINQAEQVWIPNWLNLFSDNEKGGFHERLDFEGKSIDAPRRLLTQCRQIVVYSYALKNDDKYQSKILDGFDYIKEHYFQEKTGGSFFSLNIQTNEIIEDKYDLYAHAFIILACASYLNVEDDTEVEAFAKTTLNFVKDSFRNKQFGGFEEALDKELKPVPSIRRQNPHMHLFEACVHMYEAAGDQDYLDVADEILELFFEKFFDAETKTLGEFFEEDLTPHKKEGHIIEAGHHAEWVWLLKKYEEVSNSSDPRINQTINDLFDFVMSHGIDQELGGVFNTQDRQGQVIDSNKRIWVLLETIRACAVMKASEPMNNALNTLISHYIDTETGLWNEILSKDLKPVTDYRPGTTPYHVYPVLKDSLKYLQEN